MGKSEKLRRMLRKGVSLAQKMRNERKEAGPETSPSLQIGTTIKSVPRDTTVLAAAISMGVDIDHFCGGHCSCGSCRIQVQSGSRALSKPRPDEKMVLGPDAESRGDRLACQARIQGEVAITVPEFFMV